MRLIACLTLTLLPVAAFANPGDHFHPHGIEYGWVIAAAVGLGLGYVLARWRR